MAVRYGKTVLSLSSNLGLIALFGSEKALHKWMDINEYIYKNPGETVPANDIESEYRVLRPDGCDDGSPELKLHRYVPIYSSHDEKKMHWRSP